MRTIVAVAGLETIKNHTTGKVKCFADTFLNNIRTIKHDHPKDKLVIVDAREYKDSATPMSDLWRIVKNAAACGIDELFFSVHSDWEGLYIISKYRKGEIPDSERYIELNFDWSGLNWNPGAAIRIAGCQTGGRFGQKWPKSLAQDIANKTGVAVWAFCSRSSQQVRADGHYYQKPDIGGYVKFEGIKDGREQQV